MIAHRFHAKLSRTFVVNKNNKPSNLLIRKPGSLRNFFLGFICNCLSYFTTAKISFTSILYPQLTHMIFIIYTLCQSENLSSWVCTYYSFPWLEPVAITWLKLRWRSCFPQSMGKGSEYFISVPQGSVTLGNINSQQLVLQRHCNTSCWRIAWCNLCNLSRNSFVVRSIATQFYFLQRLQKLSLTVAV